MNGVVSGTEANNKQQCSVAGLYRIWFAYAGGLVLLSVWWRNWIAMALWAILVPVVKWLHIRFYPRFSRISGYGVIEDRPAVAMSKAAGPVTYYKAIGCPFCPIVWKRLKALQQEMGFTLHTVDVSLQPNFLARYGIRSVPVVEVGGTRLVGNATSEQLARLISSPGTPAAAG